MTHCVYNTLSIIHLDHVEPCVRLLDRKRTESVTDWPSFVYDESSHKKLAARHVRHVRILIPTSAVDVVFLKD